MKDHMEEGELLEEKNSANTTTNKSSDEQQYIILDLKPQNRVVSFKIEEEVINIFDKYIRILGIGNRSYVIKRLIYAFINAVNKYLSKNPHNKKNNLEAKLQLSLTDILESIGITEKENEKTYA
jgi:hypothetical protein